VASRFVSLNNLPDGIGRLVYFAPNYSKRLLEFMHADDLLALFAIRVNHDQVERTFEAAELGEPRQSTFRP
jgi:hypothetical protein